MRVVFWGTYDTGKPRVRIIRRGLVENCIEVLECHRDVWSGIEDKSQIQGWLPRLIFLFRWFLSYPWLIGCYLKTPKHDAVVVGYMGQLDVLAIWPFAKLRGAPIVWDAFLSLYNTVVEDRQLVGQRHPIAWLLYALDWLACRVADRVLLDTRAHATYFVEKFGLPRERTDVVWVGAEPEAFPIRMGKDPYFAGEKIVLFYGQFIPLHGIETIIRAAHETEQETIRWIIIGNGQDAGNIRGMLDQLTLSRVEWHSWVNYSDLTQWIGCADVCLGIFGDTDKAARVIPNKVFQILMSGKPLITRDSPAIRELVGDGMVGVVLVPPADALALAQAVRMNLEYKPGLHSEIRQGISPGGIGRRMVEVILGAIAR